MKRALAMILAAGLSQGVALSQSTLPSDPKVRAVRRLLASDDENLHQQAFDSIRRIGPPALPLLVDLLRNQDVSFRRFAADALIDLAPLTESIQPALRRALRDEDAMVAGDAARALGALGKRAAPSAGALVNTLSHEESFVRIYAAEALASIGPSGGHGDSRPGQGPRRSGSRRPMGGV